MSLVTLSIFNQKKQHILEQFVYLFSLDLPTAVAEGERQKGKREMLCCSQHRDQTACGAQSHLCPRLSTQS